MIGMNADDENPGRHRQEDSVAVSVHGRMTHEEIARRVHVSQPAVHERVRRLEQDGVIRGYRGIVDWAAVDFGLCGFVSVQIEHERISAVLDQLFELSVPRTVLEECHRVTGPWCGPPQSPRRVATCASGAARRDPGISWCSLDGQAARPQVGH